MNLSSRLDIILNAGIATIIAIFMTYYTGLCEPWLAIACGMAAACTLKSFSVSPVALIFILISCLSLLEIRPWFLGQSSLTFGFAGLATAILLKGTQKSFRCEIVCRLVQVLPLVFVVYLMPLPASILSTPKPKRAILDAGVWGTISNLPKGSDALITKHQYTYERFQKLLGADVISPDHSLEQINELYLITPTQPFEDENIQAILDWMKKGGRLVVIADHTNLFGHQTVLQQLLIELKIALRPDAIFETKTNGGIYSNFFENFAGLTPCSISKGVIPRLKMTGWSENPDYTASSFFGDMSPSNDDRYGRYPILGSRRHGIGEVSVFTDSTFFANFTINRWSSQTLTSSLLWSRSSTAAATLGIICVVIYILKPRKWLMPLGYLFVILSPSLGFKIDRKWFPSTDVIITPPDSVSNNSEERDKGSASSMLASAYAFDIEIRWSKNAATTFKDHVQKLGMKFSQSKNEEADWLNAPPFDLQKIIKGEFYIDENSFWFNQGVGPIRAKNFANFWRSLGARIDPSDHSIIEAESEIVEINGADEKIISVEIQKLKDNWVVIDDRIVAKWIPESSKWLVRKEWQLGNWLNKDIILDAVR
jgi:hypothetical protein